MSGHWVCLLYHDVAAAPPGVSGGPEHYSVSVTGFGAQLDLIAAEGCVGVSVGRALTESGPTVAISFDDGTAGMYEHAFPMLAEHRMTATFYVTTSWIGRAGYMTWPQLREMAAAGMEIQSHTRSHPFLSELNITRLREELRGSKEDLDAHLGQETDQIALPGGDAPRGTSWEEIAAAGYRVVGTSRWGVNDGRKGVPVRIRRCTVRGDPEAAWFRRVLRGDPWLAVRRGARERFLARVRAGLGPSRYAKWRRRALDLLRVAR